MQFNWKGAGDALSQATSGFFQQEMLSSPPDGSTIMNSSRLQYNIPTPVPVPVGNAGVPSWYLPTSGYNDDVTISGSRPHQGVLFNVDNLHFYSFLRIFLTIYEVKKTLQ